MEFAWAGPWVGLPPPVISPAWAGVASAIAATTPAAGIRVVRRRMDAPFVGDIGFVKLASPTPTFRRMRNKAPTMEFRGRINPNKTVQFKGMLVLDLARDAGQPHQRLRQWAPRPLQLGVRGCHIGQAALDAVVVV